MVSRSRNKNKTKINIITMLRRVIKIVISHSRRKKTEIHCVKASQTYPLTREGNTMNKCTAINTVR